MCADSSTKLIFIPTWVLAFYAHNNFPLHRALIVLCCSLCYFWQNGNCFLGWNGVSAKFFSIPSKIYYSRAKLENNNNLARNWKKLQGTPISTQEKVSVLSKIAERATDYFPVLFCTFLASFIKQPAWLNGRSFVSYMRGPGFNPPRGNFSNDSFFIKIIFNQSGVRSPLQGVNFFL